MAFANKDLMTSVLPRLGLDAAKLANICVLQTHICHSPTWCLASCPRFGSFCGGCSILQSVVTCGRTFIEQCGAGNSCGAGGSACDPTQFCAASDPFVIQDLEDLVELRAELVQTIHQLDAMQGSLKSGITTRAEADDLEASLKAQLEHVRQVRDGLK